MTTPDAPRHGQVEVAPDVRLHTMAWDGGDRIPLLLVHGLASNAQLWSGLAALLASAGHPVIAVDQRGHGLSTPVDGPFDFATLAADLVAVLDAHDVDRAVAVGQSWGGNVVLELGLRHPDRVAGVVAVDGGLIELGERFASWAACREALAPPPLAGRSAADVEATMRAGMADWPESGVQGQLANLHRRPDGTVAPNLTLDRHLLVLRHLWEHRPSRRLPDLRPPLLLVAVRGAASDEAAVQRAIEVTPAARAHWFDGHHDVHAQQPDAVADVVGRWLADEVDGGPTGPTPS